MLSESNKKTFKSVLFLIGLGNILSGIKFLLQSNINTQAVIICTLGIIEGILLLIIGYKLFKGNKLIDKLMLIFTWLALILAILESTWLKVGTSFFILCTAVSLMLPWIIYFAVKGNSAIEAVESKNMDK